MHSTSSCGGRTDSCPELQAKERRVYDELIEGDIVEILSAYSGVKTSGKGPLGMVLAADVFVYMGALEEIFRNMPF